MNIGAVSTFPIPLASPVRAESGKPANETDEPQRTVNSKEFAAYLQMLVGSDPKLRTDLLKQLPAEGAGLLDKLLAGTTAGDSDDALLAAVPENAATSAAARAATNAATNSATDAVRYGMLLNRAPVTENQSGAIAAAAARSTKPRNAVPSIGASAQSRISPSVLARIATRKTASVEELLAVGDREGALARTKLDDLLSKAGTEEGLSLSATNLPSVPANAALAAALAASAADVETPIRDREALDPELRARFDRVAERMKREFGHDVTVVETVRSQDRQDHLYAQGRSTTGAVVTWTTDSLHTQGEALDVVVDGSWDNPKGFARLRQVAQEEGLNTLGSRDPGHLELPKDAWTNGTDVRITSSVTTAGSSSANGIARVANVARVATVATAATAGNAEKIPQPTLLNTPTNASLGLLAQNANQAGSDSAPYKNSNQGASPDRRNEQSRNTLSASDNSTEKSATRSTTSGRDKSGTQNASPVLGTTPGTTAHFIGPIDEVERPAGSTAAQAAERVEDINALRQQQGSKQLSQLTLEMDAADGTTQQITVDVRGNSVGTHITTDSVNADRMRSHADELKTGLESRGLESNGVRISSQGARSTEGTDQGKTGAGTERDAIRMNGAGASGNTAGNDGAAQQQRDRSSATRDWEDRQAARDEQRAQQERGQERGQERARRGGQNAQEGGSSSQGALRPQYQEKR